MTTSARALLAALLAAWIVPVSASESVSDSASESVSDPASASMSEKEVRDSVALGALTFSDNCSGCHQLDGYGEEQLYPSLHDPALLANRSLLIRTILDGRTAHAGTNTGNPERLMPSLSYLTDREVAGIIAFITNSWGDDIVIVSAAEVADARRQAGKDAPAQ